jgi:phosphomannomutase
MDTLRARLNYDPTILRFGTSGRRGKVVDLTQLEIYINAFAELRYLQSIPVGQGGILKGDPFYYATDLRPSSCRFVEEEKGRGEIAQAIERAILDAGMHPVNLGPIPTPALTFYATGQGKGSMMITGSHIPFDRNGYKTNSSKGELMKEDELPVERFVDAVRQQLYDQPLADSQFDERGMFKTGHQDLSPPMEEGRRAFLARYQDFFEDRRLEGQRLIVYQHSAVGRDFLVELLQGFGAQVLPMGRSETFVPIDTENIDAEQLAVIQNLADQAFDRYGAVNAVLSTDGDSDRPLILGVNSDSGSPGGPPRSVQFFGGDLVGMVVAEFLRADSVVVPISCNDAVDLGSLSPIVEPKTRIGSPFVITGMEKAKQRGRKRVCGWEANGGFLVGSDLEMNGKVLKALATRDAVLPILSVLFAAAEKKVSLTGLFADLPRRYSKAALLRQFPRSVGLRVITRFSPSDHRIREILFAQDAVRFLDEECRELRTTPEQDEEAKRLREGLSRFFPPRLGFGKINRINYTDGIRIYFDNGDIAHVRPSGNADELRIYAVADSQARADQIASYGIAEPGGILRTLEESIV